MRFWDQSTTPQSYGSASPGTLRGPSKVKLRAGSQAATKSQSPDGPRSLFSTDSGSCSIGKSHRMKILTVQIAKKGSVQNI